MTTDILRLIDASANRAREGLRVVEDYIRFSLDDAIITQQLKTFRHSFTKLINEIPLDQRLRARETRQDVGTQITLDTELHRENERSVLTANFTRIQEALRSLEEYSKVVCPTISGGLEQLRYDSYTIQKIVETIVDNTVRFPNQLNAIEIDVDTIHGGEKDDIVKEIARYLTSAFDMVCVRGKKVSDHFYVACLSELAPLFRQSGKRLCVIDRCDIVALSGVDSVVLYPGAVSVRQARELLPGTISVGVKVESDSDVNQAVLDGADWVLCLTAFPQTAAPQAILKGSF